jgi:hypothetical protein
MKTLLVGIAFVAIGMVFASQAFALPYCTNSTVHGQNACAVFEE